MESNQSMPNNLLVGRLNYTEQQWSILFSVRNEIRSSILQYILGLDDRWNLQTTLATCRFTIACLDQCISTSVKKSLTDQPSLNTLQFYQRKSQIGYSSTLNLLTLFLPNDVKNKKCEVIYSMSEDGSGADLLQQKVLLNNHSLSYLLLIQDSFGYLFGAYISHIHEQDKDSHISKQQSFLFRALPDIIVFPFDRFPFYFSILIFLFFV